MPQKIFFAWTVDRWYSFLTMTVTMTLKQAIFRDRLGKALNYLRAKCLNFFCELGQQGRSQDTTRGTKSANSPASPTHQTDLIGQAISQAGFIFGTSTFV